MNKDLFKLILILVGILRTIPTITQPITRRNDNEELLWSAPLCSVLCYTLYYNFTIQITKAFLCKYRCGIRIFLRAYVPSILYSVTQVYIRTQYGACDATIQTPFSHTFGSLPAQRCIKEIILIPARSDFESLLCIAHLPYCWRRFFVMCGLYFIRIKAFSHSIVYSVTFFFSLPFFRPFE